jgi:two-component sensor histidine kinase
MPRITSNSRSDRRSCGAPVSPPAASASRSASASLMASRRRCDRRAADQDLAAKMETSNEWIIERTGIEQRRWVSDLATNLFRIFQESLTNVARHASARQVDVVIALDHGRLHLEIADAT